MKTTNHQKTTLALVLGSTILYGCNTSPAKTPSVPTPTQPTTTQSSQQNSKQTSSSNPQEASSEQATQKTTQSDDEILNEALQELQRDKTQTTSNTDQVSAQPSPSEQATTQSTQTQDAARTPPTPPATGSLTSKEKSQQLDSELDKSFAKFDELLLKEQERLTKEQNEQGGGDFSASGNSTGNGGLGNSDAEGFEEQDDRFDTDDETNETAQSGRNPFPSDNTQADVPPDLVSTKGDDIIAKQLREAALKENDPELRERLWDEYRKYKQGIGR